MVAASFLATGTSAPPAFAPVALAQVPLYAGGSTDKPTVVLALSVEHPTAGAQYSPPSPSIGNPVLTDNTYDAAREYLGYYDVESCYGYNDAPDDAVSAGMVQADYKRFVRSGPANARRCADAFSGNFLNWASGSAIDMLRLSLSGGDRYIDTPSLTVLQRALVPKGEGLLCFWNSRNFPAKQLPSNGGGADAYWGAVPRLMIAQAQGGDIWVANMLDRIYFGTSRTGSCESTKAYALGGPAMPGPRLNSDGFFYSRVEVCSSANGVLQDERDYGLCRQYPSGNYKPVGAIQKYSDQLRLAVFGYLLDQGPTRYGGVLRAPMKYVGINTYDINGRSNTPRAGNPRAEWNPQTGVFLPNPEGDAMNTSGVINYLNKFGRSGKVPGVYKSSDPVSELYYQSLRYLQGLPPTPQAVSNITDTMKDGAPVYTEWPDPYGEGRTATADYSCQKNNIVLIGDIYSSTRDRWRNIPMSGNPTANVPDFRYWYEIVRAFEMGASSTYLDGQGNQRSTSNPNVANLKVPPYGNTNFDDMMRAASQTMGYAYWARTHDIRGKDWTVDAGDKHRPGLRVKTFIFDVNEAGTQTDPTVRRASNPFFMAAKYGGFETDKANPSGRPYNTQGNPFIRDDGTPDNDIWQKPGMAGEASTYYMQSDGRGVLDAFEEIFKHAATTARSIAGASMSAGTASTNDGAVMYSARLDTSAWSGDVVAEPLDLDSKGQLLVDQPLWSAAQRLDAMASPATNRKIFAGRARSANGSAGTATAFTWDAIGDTLRAQLGKPNPAAEADGLGEQRLNYLRGNRSKDGDLFRMRSSLLGDIGNSNVAYSGAPTMAYGDAGYAAFRASHDARTKAVFVGANDGMLHAFNAGSGDELFAYIPSWMGPRLSALTEHGYVNNHQSYVDGQLAVAEAQVAFAGEAGDWKTVLVGGTGAGGSGVFALDVSDPANFSATKAMWEFTRADDADMGQVIGQPQILKLKTSASDAAQATYRWFAVVGSGVNNYVPEGADGAFSTTGRPALFLLALDKAPGTAWEEGVNYYKVSLPMDATLAATKAPGLANFTPLYGADGAVTDIYAGDLHGNLWKLQFRDRVPGNWNMGRLSVFGNGSSARPFYRARDGQANVQPITAAPAVFTGPRVQGRETFYVAIGTGKYLEAADAGSTVGNSFYVLYDNGTATPDDASPSAAAISGRGRLAAAVVDGAARSISVPAFRWGRATGDGERDVRSGWYFDFMPGERAISDMADLGSLKAAFNTLIPGAVTGTGTCGDNQGGGNAYAVDISGSSRSSYVASTIGVLGPALYFAKADDVKETRTDSTGRRMRVTTQHSVNTGKDGVTSLQKVDVRQVVGRLSWRQIVDYQDMRSAASAGSQP